MIPGLGNKRVVNFYDLMIYVALVRKHLRLMVLLVCMCLLFGLTLYLYSRPIYYSNAIVQFDYLNLPLDSDAIFHDGNFGSIVGELKSPEVIRRTAARLGVDAPASDIMGKYLRDVRITNNDGNIDIQTWSYVRSWPAHWPEIMVEEFMKLRAEQRERYRDTITSAYSQELNHLVDRMDQQEKSRFSFQDQNQSTQAYVEVTSIGNIPAQLAQVRQIMDQLDSIRSRLDDPTIDTIGRLSIIETANAESPLRVGDTVGNPSVSGSTRRTRDENADSVDSTIVPGVFADTTEWPTLERRQRLLLQQISVLAQTYRPGNQKMAAVQKELDQVQQSLDLDYDLARNRFDLICRAMQQRYNDLEKKIPEYVAANRKYSKIQQTDQLNQAGQLGWTGMYDEAAQAISKLEYTADRERVNLRFDHYIATPADPVSPNKANMCLFALVAGIALAFIIPFLIEYLDYTLSNLEEVEATFQLRGLGIIPQIPHETDEPMLLTVGAERDERNLIENFRVVRTNLLAMGTLTKAAQVTMVTSSMPKEGKTVVSSNLAISFGQTGARTLLVDTDLRRGRLHRLFGFRKSPGLADYLLGKVTLDEAIRPTGKDNLSVLSAGQHLESGTEMLGSPKFAELMATLRTRYDRIIVDTPPVLGLSETSVLQPHVDGVLFVIWSGRTPIRNMKTAIDILSANGANLYGFILNRLDLTATTNYYQYYYYSSDYYHSYHALENA